MLTPEEMAAVEWWAKYHNGVEPENMSNTVRSLCESGNISGMLDSYRKNAGNEVIENKMLVAAKQRKEMREKSTRVKTWKSKLSRFLGDTIGKKLGD